MYHISKINSCQTNSGGHMKKILEQYPAEVYISAADLEHANLSEWNRLELHLLNQVAAVLPGQMTAMELIRTVESLQKLSAELLTALGSACEKCDGCNVELFCDLMKGDIRPEVSIPIDILMQSNLDPDCKLTYEIDSETGAVSVVEADHRFDLTDIPRELLDTIRESGICLDDLDEKLKAETIVYGVDRAESFQN